VLVADDHAVIRAGIRFLIARSQRFVICGEAAGGEDAITRAATLQPDVTVMDVEMDGISGVEATREILKIAPRARVLILSMHDSPQVLRQAVDAGAHGYVLKSDAHSELITALNALSEGKTYFTSAVASLALDASLRRAGTHPLSNRQRDIVMHLASGKSNKETAWELRLSPKTVESHRYAIMQKLSLRSFSELVRYAIREGIVKP
jgi:DNA-binding NarL/FixJ family response regulator